MPKNIINNVRTRPIGFAPILAHYFKKCGIVDIIDAHVPTDPRRKVLTHGQACIAMITGILFQTMQLYRICQFARESTVLDALLPGIDPRDYFDNRLADTLDALYDFGLGNLETMITTAMINAFHIKTEICHNDTTCAFVYGDADNHRSADGIKITFGYRRGFEVPLIISHENKEYAFRMIILFDYGLFHRKKKSLEQRVEKTRQAFGVLSARLREAKKANIPALLVF